MNLVNVGIKVINKIEKRTAWVEKIECFEYFKMLDDSNEKLIKVEDMKNDVYRLKCKIKDMLEYKKNIDLYSLSAEQALVVIFKYYYLLTEEEKEYCKVCDKKISKIMREKQKEVNKINRERMYRKYKRYKKGKRKIS